MNYDKYVSDAVKNIKPSGIRKFFDVAAMYKDVISLGVGEPDFVTPWEAREAAVQSIRKGITQYTSNSGLLQLREAVSRYIDLHFGVKYDPKDEIVMTVGASEAIYLAVRTLANAGDEVIIPEPSYVSYAPGVAFCDAVPVIAPCRVEDNFTLTAEALESVITPRTKALILPFPNNPTGAIMNREQLESIAAVIKKHDIIVISDEIYAELTFGRRHTSIASLDGMRERTVVVNGFSKSYAMTGWRIGYAAANKELAKVMSNYLSHSTGAPSTVSQWAAVEALSGPQETIEAMRKVFEERRNYLVSRLNSIPGVSCITPNGAFYVMMNIEKLIGRTLGGRLIENDDDFGVAFLEKGLVAVVPCSGFGIKNFVRWTYATSMENIKEGLDRLEKFLAE